jgi:hypothetical protein
MVSNFNLPAAFKDWRQRLAAQKGFSHDARRELEAHLLDLFSELRGGGLDDEKAFEAARKRIGELNAINREFKKAMKTTIHHWAFGIAAWAGFTISFFLPAYDQMPGWRAAILQDYFWPQAMQGNLLAVHYLLLTGANLVMVVSPFFMAWGKNDVRFVKWLRGLSLGAMTFVWLFLARLFGNHDGNDLRIGCYLWAASFVLLCLASLAQPMPLKAKAPEAA